MSYKPFNNYFLGPPVSITNDTVSKFLYMSATPSSTESWSGLVIACVKSTDGTDYQTKTVTFDFAASLTGGLSTAAATSTPTETDFFTSGTMPLVGGITNADEGSGIISFALRANSSLTTPTMTVQCTALKTNDLNIFYTV